MCRIDGLDVINLRPVAAVPTGRVLSSGPSYLDYLDRRRQSLRFNVGLPIRRRMALSGSPSDVHPRHNATERAKPLTVWVAHPTKIERWLDR